MNIIKAEKIIYDYIRKNDEEEVCEICRAIDDVDLNISEGEFIAILGHNGSGKSTLARHINALLVPTSGTLWVDGKDTSDEMNIYDIRQRAGMVFQNPDNQIIATMVEEDVAFGPENLGVETEEIWKRVDEALASVNMVKYRDYSPNRLSGGQKQRVAIAGVLAMLPKCIVLDEPTAMLDPSGRKEVIDTVKKLNRQEKVTIILITHYMDEVVDADRVIVMDKGKIAMQGTPRQIFSKANELEKLGLCLPVATELANQLVNSGVHIKADVLSIDELVEELCQLK